MVSGKTAVRTNTKWDNVLKPIDRYRYLIPRSYKPGMKVDCLIFSSPSLLEAACRDLSLEQAANVATLPGVIDRAIAMPDMHQGYGFPIGGVAAMDVDEGVVSPGGVGFDINCGVRSLTSPLHIDEVRPRLEDFVFSLYKAVPAGTGSDGKLTVSGRQLDRVLEKGARWAVEEGYATGEDLSHTEDFGCLEGADPSAVSERARKRGSTQLGTLGSGNHFLEIQYVQQIFDEQTAGDFGLFLGQLLIMIHCGSRGLGHQVCTDFVSTMKPVMDRYRLAPPDRELACAPIRSPEGQTYLGAMAAAANFAFANRQCISHWAQQVVDQLFGRDTRLKLLYDVAHNMAKLEVHRVAGADRQVLVHRKGATRAFPAGRAELPPAFKDSGQPVIIPGDMGRASYILVGTGQALAETFGSVCHGAGRLMSRTQARKGRQAADVIAELREKGVIARATSREGLTEEVPEAYKSVDEVVGAVDAAGLARRVARLKPVGVVKG